MGTKENLEEREGQETLTGLPNQTFNLLARTFWCPPWGLGKTLPDAQNVYFSMHSIIDNGVKYLPSFSCRVLLIHSLLLVLFKYRCLYAFRAFASHGRTTSRLGKIF